jgi:hypothetical protein
MTRSDVAREVEKYSAQAADSTSNNPFAPVTAAVYAIMQHGMDLLEQQKVSRC